MRWSRVQTSLWGCLDWKFHEIIFGQPPASIEGVKRGIWWSQACIVMQGQNCLVILCQLHSWVHLRCWLLTSGGSLWWGHQQHWWGCHYTVVGSARYWKLQLYYHYQCKSICRMIVADVVSQPCDGAVLYCAPPIPVGLWSFQRNLVESTGLHWNKTIIQSK